MNPTSKEDVGMSVVGIDPGVDGAIAFLHPHPTPPQVWMMPTIQRRVNNKNRTEVDGYKLADIFREIQGVAPDHVVLEHLWPFPHDTPVTAWGLSGRYHRCSQAMDSLGMAYHLVAPVKWKNKVIGHKDIWKGNKQASVEYINERYPEWPLRVGRQTTDKDGIADALCLALYGRRVYE